MAKGYVYVLANEGMPNLRKIGRSKEGGRIRARQLYQTGVPHPFIVEFELLTEYPESVEEIAHEKLQTKRVNGSREFFAVDQCEAEHAVIDAHLWLSDHCIVHAEEKDAIISLSMIASDIDVHHMEIISSLLYVERDAFREGVRKWLEKVRSRKTRLAVVGEVN